MVTLLLSVYKIIFIHVSSNDHLFTCGAISRLPQRLPWSVIMILGLLKSSCVDFFQLQ